MRFGSFLLFAAIANSALAQNPAPANSRLHLQEYVSDTLSWNVVSTLIVGPTEVMLVDAQMTMSDGKRVADMIEATGRRLTGIFITHPDEDHALGLQAILTRFPGTPVYMTAQAVEHFVGNAPRFMVGLRRYLKAEAPDSAVIPQALPSNRLTVDGEAVEIVPDLQGDVVAKTNSFVFIPSLNAVIAGDIVFSGLHPFLGHSSPATREAWQSSLAAIAARQPRIVVPGHKPSVDYADSPDAIQFMSKYLRDFEEARRKATNAGELITSLRSKYPELQTPALLTMSARGAFAPNQGTP